MTGAGTDDERDKAIMHLLLAQSSLSYALSRYQRDETDENWALYSWAMRDVTEAEQALADLSTKH